MLKNNTKNQKGVSIFLALTVMTVFLAISLGLSVLLLGETKMIRGMGYSVIAFYAADTGMEEILYLDLKCRGSYCNSDPGDICLDPPECLGLRSDVTATGVLDNGASYEAEFSGGPFSTCYGRSFDKNTTSTGSYKEVKRSIRTTTEAPYLSCDGATTTFDGFCWYEGEAGQSCETICSFHDGNVGECRENDNSNCDLCKIFHPFVGSCGGFSEHTAPFYHSDYLGLGSEICAYRQPDAGNSECWQVDVIPGEQRFCACCQ